MTGKTKNYVIDFIAIFILLLWFGTKPIISWRYACIILLLINFFFNNYFRQKNDYKDSMDISYILHTLFPLLLM